MLLLKTRFQSTSLIATLVLAMTLGMTTAASASTDTDLDDPLVGLEAALGDIDQLESLIDETGEIDREVAAQTEGATIVNDDHLIIDSGEGIVIEMRRGGSAADDDASVGETGEMGTMATQGIRIGFGWRVYIYIIGAILNTAAAMGAAWLIPKVCAPAMLTGSFGAVACRAAVASIINWLRGRTIGAWTCYEFSFNYGGGNRQVKTVAIRHCGY